MTEKASNWQHFYTFLQKADEKSFPDLIIFKDAKITSIGYIT